MRKSTLLFLTVLLTVTTFSFGQTIPQVVVPNFSDKFCDYVKILEAGQTDIDYQDFRFSFIESEQFKVASKKSSEFDSLKKEMYVQMDKSNYQEVIQMRYFQEMTYQEMAEQIDEPLNNIKIKLLRAKKLLAEIISGK